MQYLRGAAALLVVFYHVLQWRRGGFEVGRSGVDIFFVISGFVIWRITARRRARPGVFLWRRLTRVAPAYWLATLLLIAVVLAWPAFLPKVKPLPGHVLLSLAFIPHLDPLGAPFPLLAPGWTLSYEAGFYLVFGAALFAPPPMRPWLVGGAAIAVVAAGLALADPIYGLGANPLVFEFVFGVLIGVAADAGRLPPPLWSAALLVLGPAALTLYALTGWRDEVWRFLTWGAPAAAIVAGAVGLETRRGVFRSRVLLALGEASYSLYLFHVIAVAAVAHAIGVRPAALFIPTALAAAIAAGFGGRLMVERPLTAWLRRSTAAGRGGRASL